MARRLRRAVLASALLAAGLTAAGATAAPGGAPCDQVNVSPDFAKDGRALCVSVVRADGVSLLAPPRGFAVSATTDGGRTWQRRKGAGITVGPHSVATLQVHFSATYADDGEVYADLDGSGRWVSTDLGDTWTSVPGASGQDMAPFRMPVTPAGELPVRWVGAFALGSGAAVCSSSSSRDDVCLGTQSLLVRRRMLPVAGAQDASPQFLVPTTYPADLPIAVAEDHAPVGPPGSPREPSTYLLVGCTAVFTCDRQLHTWPKGWRVERAWLSPAFGADRTVYALVHDGSRLLLQRSSDGGRQFATLRAATALLGAGPNSFAQHGSVTLATDPRRPRRLWLRLSAWGRQRQSPPGEQVFVSDDAGGSWARTAYGLAPGQRGRPGALPFTAKTEALSQATVVVAGAKLFAVGRVEGKDRTVSYAGVFCSVDGGRRWARNCPH